MFIFDICFKVSFYFFIFFNFLVHFRDLMRFILSFSPLPIVLCEQDTVFACIGGRRGGFFYAFWATCLPLVEKVRSATCLLVVWVGVALHQLSHTYCENVGAALWLLADGRGRVGGSDGLNAHLPLTYAGGGGNGGGVVAECTPTIGRLGSERD